jgi:hypothetical protein
MSIRAIGAVRAACVRHLLRTPEVTHARLFHTVSRAVFIAREPTSRLAASSAIPHAAIAEKVQKQFSIRHEPVLPPHNPPISTEDEAQERFVNLIGAILSRHNPSYHLEKLQTLYPNLGVREQRALFDTIFHWLLPSAPYTDAFRIKATAMLQSICTHLTSVEINEFKAELSTLKKEASPAVLEAIHHTELAFKANEALRSTHPLNKDGIFKF